MSKLRCRLRGATAMCISLVLPALGFGTAVAGFGAAVLGFGAAVAQASVLPAPLDDPGAAPPAPPAPDPSTVINQANAILPMIMQYLPPFLNPGAAPDPGATGTLAPQMQSPVAPGS